MLGLQMMMMMMTLSLSLFLSFFLSASVYYEGRGGAPLMSRDRADAVAE